MFHVGLEMGWREAGMDSNAAEQLTGKALGRGWETGMAPGPQGLPKCPKERLSSKSDQG